MQIYSGFWNKSANGMMKRLSEHREHMVIWSSSLCVNTFKSIFYCYEYMNSLAECLADNGSVTDTAVNESVAEIK